MKRIYYILVFLPLLCSCALIGKSSEYMSQDEHDAWIIHKKAMKLLSRNQLDIAENMFLDAYNKFTLLDVQTGKMQALSGLAKFYSVTGNKEKKYDALRKLRAYADYNTTSKTLYTLTLAEIYQQENKPDSVFALLEGMTFQTNSELDVLLMIYRLNAGLSSKKQFDITGIEQSLTIVTKQPFEDLEHPMLPAFGYYTLALAHLYKADVGNAERLTLKALEFDRISANSRGIADDYILLGDIFQKSGRVNQSYPSYIRAAEIFNLLNLELDRQLTMIKAISTDRNASAAEKQDFFKKLYRDTQYPVVKQKVLDILGHVE